MIKKNKNDYLFFNLTNLVRVYSYLIVIFFIFRVFFTYYYGELDVLADNKTDLFSAYFLGWKYDNLVISYAFVIPFLLNVLGAFFANMRLNNMIQYLMKGYFFVISSFMVMILISDMAFYNYFQDHINILFYGVLEDDTMALIETIRKNYPFEMIISFIGIFLCFNFWINMKLTRLIRGDKSIFPNGFLKFVFATTISLIILVGGLRGGYSMLVISPKYSDFSDIEFINQVSLNGLVTLEKAIKLRRNHSSKNYNLAKNFGYHNIHEAYGDYLGVDVSHNSDKELINLLKRKTSQSDVKDINVVVIVMESFGAHWLQYNSESFNFLGDLGIHFKEDYLFSNVLSEDNGTIGSLMAIASNIPNRPGARFLSESKYMRLALPSAAHVPFKNKGYETSFYYGGKLGWRDIGKYFRYQGYHNLVGENAITKSLKLEGVQGTEWGLYDEHLFSDILRRLKSSSRPQFILALSTTNHPPFEVPKTFKQGEIKVPKSLDEKIRREKDIFLERFKTFYYTNQKLAEFISSVKSSSLGEKTIVAVTGDHNFWGFINYSKEETFLKHTVPLYFYLPNNLRPKKVDLSKLGSHKDIMSTLYHLSLSDTEYLSFGGNLFGSQQTFAFNNNVYANSEGLIFKNQSYEWSSTPYMLKEKSEKKLDGLRQHYKSTLSVADHFLRMIYKQSKN